MKKNIPLFLLFFLFHSGIVFSQSNLSFGFAVSSETSFFKIQNSFAPQGLDEKVDPSYGFSMGVFGTRAIPFGFIRLGVNFEFSSYQHRIDGLRFESDYDLSTGKRYKSYIQNSMKMITLNFPIEVAFNVFSVNENLDLYLGGGGEYNLLLNKNFKSEIVHENIQNQSLESDQKVSISPLSGIAFIGMRFKQKKIMEILLEPYLKYNPVNFVLTVYSSKAVSNLELGISVKGNFIGKKNR